MDTTKKKRALRRSTIEALVFLVILFAVSAVLANKMGGANLVKTIMNTAHDLLLNTEKPA